MGGTFDLRFSRCYPPYDFNEATLRHDVVNPHDDAEPFLRNVLRPGHGRLAPSLHRLVTILRETLPIVTVLEEIRQKSEVDGHSVDVFAKAAGWYRLLYGDLRSVCSTFPFSGQLSNNKCISQTCPRFPVNE